MKGWAIALVFILLVGMIPMWHSGYTSAQSSEPLEKNVVYLNITFNITPSDDAYVYQRYPTRNYGSSYSLWVGYYYGYEYTFLKFNLSEIPKDAIVTNATLYLYAYKVYRTPVVGVHFVENDSWSENTITWNNMPAYNSTSYTVVTIGEGAYRYYSFNVTNLTESQVRGDEVLSLALIPLKTYSVNFNSKEAPKAHPYLIVHCKVPVKVRIKKLQIPEFTWLDNPVEINVTLSNEGRTTYNVTLIVIDNGSVFYIKNVTILGEEIRKVKIPWSTMVQGKHELEFILKLSASDVVLSKEKRTINVLSIFPPGGETYYKVGTSADTFIKEGSNRNYGNWYSVYVGTYRGAREIGLFKFNVSAFTNVNISKIEACFYVYKKYSPRDVPVGVYPTSPNWSEGHVNWFNAPKIYWEEELSNFTVKNVGRYYCVDVTKAFNGSPIISLALYTKANTSIGIDSKEYQNSRHRAYLVIRAGYIEKTINGTDVIIIGGVEKPRVANVTAEVVYQGTLLKFPISKTGHAVFLLNELSKLSRENAAIVGGWNALLVSQYFNTTFIENRSPEKIVITRITTFWVNVIMSPYDGVALIAIPLNGAKPYNLTVVKENESYQLKKNSTPGYYVSKDTLFLVLKAGDQVVEGTLVSYETIPLVRPNPGPFNDTNVLGTAQLYVRFYLNRIEKNEKTLEELIGKFLNLSNGSNSTKVKCIALELKRYETVLKELKKSLKTEKPNLRLFVESRDLYLLQKKLITDLRIGIKELKGEKRENIKVLIDAYHEQYYVNKVGVTGLIKYIENDLGWNVTIGYSPLTVSLLKNYDVVIILNPKRDLTNNEVKALLDFVKGGGSLIVAGDWYRYLNPSLNELVKNFGIIFNFDELIDGKHNSGKPYYPFIGIYNKNASATKFIPSGWVMYYSGDTLSYIKTLNGTMQPNFTITWLVRGYNTSYSKNAEGKLVWKQGTIPIVAVAVQYGRGRVVIYGSSRAFSDSYGEKYINSNWPFIKGVLLWLTKKI